MQALHWVGSPSPSSRRPGRFSEGSKDHEAHRHRNSPRHPDRPLPPPAPRADGTKSWQRVILPCVVHAAHRLGLEGQEVKAAETIIYKLHRQYYEDVIEAVEAVLRVNPDSMSEPAYRAGLAACIKYQDVEWTFGR